MINFSYSPVEIANKLNIPQQNYDSPEHDFPLELIKLPYKPAAVLIPLFRMNNNWRVLFIRRTADLTEHSGQVAFPGGCADSDDEDPIQTALREAWEEIGLHQSNIKILGRMNKFLTITNFSVIPIIGEIPWPYKFKPEKREVARIFHIPLKWLSDPNNREERIRNLPEPFAPINVIYFRSFKGENLWGVTARIMVTLLGILDN